MREKSVMQGSMEMESTCLILLNSNKILASPMLLSQTMNRSSVSNENIKEKRLSSEVQVVYRYILRTQYT